ncbi:acyltransferase family protein [Flavobacterium sp. FZUC8N2.13]|uniref:Acyltransferase family protein n=1 Tax=Flavobacterium zubiriense TaxID=3138075 RepID=A0ABV4TDR8_9FLAO
MSSKPTYRPDIDGLRAIAILLVIIFHAGFSLFPGGFIGVDVFFVISGFLITSIIEKEIKENSFSFKNFYLRRIRRIVPVLVFIMLIITIPAYFILFANNLEAYSRTLIYTFLCANNFHLYFNSGDYFAESSDLIPFLHTWSLSVEEQFYFFLPPFLILLHKKVNSKKRFIIIISLCIIGLLFSIYQSYANPKMAYFLLPARLFELLIGCCLAISWEKLPNFNVFKNHTLSIIGILLILIPAIVLNNSSVFPGLNALWPCLGTALLLITGKTEASKGIVNQLIQNKLMVGIGLISYSLYLWHWPIFVLIKYLGINLEGMIRIIALAATFLLSYLSWRYIEQPFRTTLKFDFKKTILIIFAPSLIIIGIIYGVLDAKDGFPERHPDLAEFNPKKNYPNKLRSQCFDKFKVGNCEDCFLGIKKDSLDGMLIGDSFANHTAAFLDVLAKDADLYIHDSAAGGYPLMNGLNKDGSANFPEQYAIDRLNYAKKFKTIYIAANWEGLSESKNAQTYHSTLQSLGELVKSGKKIIIFEALRKMTALNLHRAKLVKAKIPVYFSEKDFSITEYKRPNDYIIDVIKQKFPSIMIIDLNQLMCENGKCDIELNNTIVYRNEDHLNTSGAQLLGELYIEKYGNPLKKVK